MKAMHHAARAAALSAALAAALWAAGCATFGERRPPLVSVPQIIAMSRAGVPAAEIIRQIRASGTVYRLQASQLADLEKQGVPPAVIDCMQQTFLEAVQRDAAYNEWSRWQLYGDFWYGGAPFGWPYDQVVIIREHGAHPYHHGWPHGPAGHEHRP